MADNGARPDGDELAGVAARVGSHVAPVADGRGAKIALACSQFNGDITLRLLDGALEALVELGVAKADLAVAWAPGAFELPLLAEHLIRTREGYDAVIALGAVIRGETGHYDVVANECARGIQEVQLRLGVPVIFGVLTTNDRDQAMVRSAPDGMNKGRECAIAALEMAAVLRS